MRNLYVIGFMGAGKTCFGKCLASRLGRELVDMDDEFARVHQGVTTGEYIKRHGLPAFRLEEQAVLKSMAAEFQEAIVVTGAGVPVYEGNRQIIREDGPAIHLKVPLQSILRRMTPEDLARRPLWTERTMTELEALYDERLPIYDSAEYIVNGDQPTEGAVSDFLKLYRG